MHCAERGDDARGVLAAAVVELERDGIAAQVALQLLGRPRGHDAAVARDREPVGEGVRLLEVVRREQDRQPLARGEARELVPHRNARLGVETGRRLVEIDDARAVHECDRDVEPALHPARVAADDAVSGPGEVEQLEQFADAPAHLVPAEALDLRVQRQVLAAGRRTVDARRLRHVADRLADRARFGGDVVTRDDGAPGVGLRERREDPHGRRLPRAVRSE